MDEKFGIGLFLRLLMGGLLLSAGCGDVPFILFDDNGDFTFVAPKDGGANPADSGPDRSIEESSTVRDETDKPLPGCETDASAGNNPERIIALADLHGYLPGVRRILWLTGLTDEHDHWIGGESVLVQTGDTIDRGDWDKEVIDLLEILKMEAKAAGGNVHILIGNHETDNVMGYFDYVNGAAFAAFDTLPYDLGDAEIGAFPEDQRARAAAFRPGGEYAKILAGHKVAMILGGTLFVHAGLSPEYTDYGIYKLNEKSRDWLLGDIPRPDFIKDEHGPFRNRHYGYPDEEDVDCDEVREVADRLCVKRIVMGHTIQDGINAICNGLLYRIDVGMYMEKRVGAIEIMGNNVRFIEESLDETTDTSIGEFTDASVDTSPDASAE